MSLHNYIHDSTLERLTDPRTPNNITTVDPAVVSSIRNVIGEPDFNPSFVVGNATWSIRLFNIWTIMKEIAAGLTFIHEHGQVHRDLKPRNGIITPDGQFSANFSDVLFASKRLENSRFWDFIAGHVESRAYHIPCQRYLRLSCPRTTESEICIHE